MNKQEFYTKLIESNTSLKDLFEGYTGESFVELRNYVISRAEDEFRFPNDNNEGKENLPMIELWQKERLNIFSRTLEEGSSYSPEGLREAEEFVEKKRAIIG